jgi:DoxX-like protein
VIFLTRVRQFDILHTLGKEISWPQQEKVVWTGWIISILASLVFLMSGTMKFVGGPQVEQGLTHLGLGNSMVITLGILELACLVIYLIPPTAVLGAILMTGYVGGIILTHWRVGDPVYLPIVLGLMIWLGLYLREPRLKELIPLRRTSIG